jgi:hypothetical protein
MELEESVKAHTLDLSHQEGRLLTPEEGARHWYDKVFKPVLEIIESTDASRLLGPTTDADRYLIFRRGIEVPMHWDWRIPAAAAERGIANVTQARGRWSNRVHVISGRSARPAAPLMPDEAESKLHPAE